MITDTINNGERSFAHGWLGHSSWGSNFWPAHFSGEPSWAKLPKAEVFPEELGLEFGRWFLLGLYLYTTKVCLFMSICIWGFPKTGVHQIMQVMRPIQCWNHLKPMVLKKKPFFRKPPDVYATCHCPHSGPALLDIVSLHAQGQHASCTFFSRVCIQHVYNMYIICI